MLAVKSHDFRINGKKTNKIMFAAGYDKIWKVKQAFTDYRSKMREVGFATDANITLLQDAY